MRIKTRKQYSSYTNCHPLLLETRRISKADIAAGCSFQLWQSGPEVVILLYAGVMGWRWGKPWRKRSSSESVKKAAGLLLPFLLCATAWAESRDSQGRDGRKLCIHSGVTGWILRVRLDSSWCAVSERSNRTKKWEGNVSRATTTVRSPRWI